MKLNLKVRIKNKSFWIAFIPAVVLLIQLVAALFGFSVDLGVIGNQLVSIVNAIFGVLAVLGVVSDPTTPGVSDSERALSYDKPGEPREVP